MAYKNRERERAFQEQYRRENAERRKAYDREYYLTHTKPKREAARAERPGKEA